MGDFPDLSEAACAQKLQELVVRGNVAEVRADKGVGRDLKAGGCRDGLEGLGALLWGVGAGRVGGRTPHCYSLNVQITAAASLFIGFSHVIVQRQILLISSFPLNIADISTNYASFSPHSI